MDREDRHPADRPTPARDGSPERLTGRVGPAADSEVRWTGTHKALHWILALAVLVQVGIGFGLDDYPEGTIAAADALGRHATLGLSIGALMLVRLGWRLTHPVPPLPDTLTLWQKRLARATHWGFYALLVAMPIGGWLMVAASDRAVQVFGNVLPAPIAPDDGLAGVLWTLHLAGAVLVSLLFAVHAGAAIRHAVVLKDDILARMLPGE